MRAVYREIKERERGREWKLMHDKAVIAHTTGGLQTCIKVCFADSLDSRCVCVEELRVVVRRRRRDSS